MSFGDLFLKRKTSKFKVNSTKEVSIANVIDAMDNWCQMTKAIAKNEHVSGFGTSITGEYFIIIEKEASATKKK